MAAATAVVGLGERRQPLAQQFLVAVAFGHGRGVGVQRVGEVAEGGGEAAQLVGTGGFGRGRRSSSSSDARRDGQLVVEVAHRERAAVADDRQLARLEDPADLVAEHRHQDPCDRLGVAAGPVDVEGGGVQAGRTVLQDVPPPGVGPAGDGHVVRDDVEHVAQAVGAQGSPETLVAGGAAELLVDVAVVDHVVAVGAAGRRLQDGRGVEVADAERGQVRHHGGGIVEGETGVELARDRSHEAATPGGGTAIATPGAAPLTTPEPARETLCLSTVLSVRSAPSDLSVRELPPPVTDEEQRRADLRRMKVFATALLAAAAVVFVVTRSLEDSVSWLAPVRATAEAAMVGALADWFAVTALFRHPARHPHPAYRHHPRQQGPHRAVPRSVRAAELPVAWPGGERACVTPSRRGGRERGWPTASNAHRASETVATVVSGLPDVLDDDEISGAVRHAIIERIRATPAAPLLARGLEVAIAEGHHHTMVDAVLARSSEYLDDNRDVLYERLRTESPWWVPGVLDERIFGKIFRGAQRLVADLEADPDHELRHDIDVRLRELVERLRTDPELAARVEGRKEQLLDHPDVQAWAGSVWADVKDYLVTSARDSRARCCASGSRGR